MLQAWMLQDAPNHRGTERRGYGVGGNVKGPAAQPRRPNKGHIGYGSGENGTELDALYRALRGERERAAVYARYQSRQTSSGDWRREGGQASADEGLLLLVCLIYAHFNLVGINSG